MENKKIRKLMKKEIGYNSRQVSVKGGYGSKTFTIRDEEVDYKKVKNFAEKFEEIKYDERSGEILSGGNIFITVRIDEKILKEMEKEVERILKQEVLNPSYKVYGVEILRINGSINLYDENDNRKICVDRADVVAKELWKMGVRV